MKKRRARIAAAALVLAAATALGPAAQLASAGPSLGQLLQQLLGRQGGPTAQIPSTATPRPDRPPETCTARSGRAGLTGLPGFPCDFPDPMVMRAGRTYFAYGTSTGWEPAGRSLPILRSRDLRHWRRAGDALHRRPRWADRDVWAPSVIRARGRYLMYYGARSRKSHGHCVAVATARRPQGPFRDRGPISCGDRKGNGYIDPAPLIVRGRGYLFFSVDRPRHSISVLRLSGNLLRKRGRRRVVLRGGRAWQKHLLSGTVEGPWPVRRRGRVYLLYSTGCWCLDYRMGLAVARRPLGPYRDTGRNPFLRPGRTLVGPGGGSLFSDPRGRAWLAFHAWTGLPGYGPGGERTLRTARFRWGDRPLLNRSYRPRH